MCGLRQPVRVLSTAMSHPSQLEHQADKSRDRVVNFLKLNCVLLA